MIRLLASFIRNFLIWSEVNKLCVVYILCETWVHVYRLIDLKIFQKVSLIMLYCYIEMQLKSMKIYKLYTPSSE